MGIHEISIRSSLKWGLLLGTMLSSPLAFAQSNDETIDNIIVRSSPIRDSQAAAIEAKREADNVIDVISADTIGRFPDQNLADSLGRVPGLAIERDQGQARFINFRGAPFRFTAIAFDGVDVPGAENGRIPRFDAFPSVITSRIEVNKAITADMPGESVAGFIDIQTFNPFDRDGFSASAEVGYGKQALGNQDINKYNGRISFSNDKFGILGFASHNLRGRITDNREYELAIDPATDEIIPENLDFRSYRGDREDNAFGGTIELRPWADARIFASTLYSEFIDREERNQFDFEIASGPAPLTPTTGYQPGIEVVRLLESGRYNNSTWTSTLGTDFSVAEWNIEARLNYTETEFRQYLPLIQSRGGVAAVSYDVSDIRNPLVDVFAPGTMTPTDVNELSYAVNLGIAFFDKLESETIKAKLDAERNFDFFGLDTTIKTGFQLDRREANGGVTLSFGLFPSVVNIDDFVSDELWDSDFSNTIGGRNVDNPALLRAWEAALGETVLPSEFDDDEIIKIDEDIYAGYAMGTTRFSWGSVVLGVRVEATQFDASGVALDGATTTPISKSNNYVHVLPNAHLNVDVMEDLKLRLSASTGVSRPTYTEARASISVDPTSLPDPEISGGNPELDAEFAWGGDVSLEYYFDNASILSVGAFARFIDNVIYPDTVIVADGSTIAPGLIAPGTPTKFDSFFNGEDGELFGFEANFIGQATFLPWHLDGLGFSGNVTLLDSSFKAPTRPTGKFDLPGTSDLVYNLSLFYEKFGMSARLNYQFRSAWLSTTENDSLTEFWDDTERLDASIRYTIPKQPGGVTMTLFANGNNLSDAKDLRYVNSPATPNQYEGFGRRFTFGLRADY